MTDALAFTAERLTALCHARQRHLPPEIATSYAAALEAVRVAGKLTTAVRVCQFIGQIGTETGGFQSLVESLKYRDPARLAHLFSAVHGVDDATNLIAAGEQAIGNRVYANRNGNGNEASGDGFRYRGRGFIMLTGRANYAVAGRDARLPLVEQPELLGQAPDAARAAMAYWTVRGINGPADLGDTKAVTAKVNSALVALDDRMAWVQAASRIWVAAPALVDAAG